MPRSIPIGTIAGNSTDPSVEVKVIDIRLDPSNSSLFLIGWNWLHQPPHWGIDDDDEGFFNQAVHAADVIIVCTSLSKYLAVALLKRSTDFGGYLLSHAQAPAISKEEQVFHNLLHLVRTDVIFVIANDQEEYDPEVIAREAIAANPPAVHDIPDPTPDPSGRAAPVTANDPYGDQHGRGDAPAPLTRPIGGGY